MSKDPKQIENTQIQITKMETESSLPGILPFRSFEFVFEFRISNLGVVSMLRKFQICLVSPFSNPLSRRALHRTQNSRVRAAAAEVSGQRLFDLAIRWFWISIEQHLGAHDHAVDAIAALHR